MIMLARRRGIKILLLSRWEIMETFLLNPRQTKHTMAEILSKTFPELSVRLPVKRRTWMPEDYRMSIFEAVAMVVVASRLPFSENGNEFKH